MATTVIVVPKADAERTREALGRAYAKALGVEYPIQPDTILANADGTFPEPLPTLYYADPIESKDGTECAFKVESDIDAQLGKAVTLEDGSKVTPTTAKTSVDLKTWAKADAAEPIADVKAAEAVTRK